MSIYFIQSIQGGPIKIGYVHNRESIIERLKTIQLLCPIPLQVIGIINGEVLEERELHRKFLEFRLHGEWFEPIPEIYNYIVANNGIIFIPPLIGDKKIIYCKGRGADGKRCLRTAMQGTKFCYQHSRIYNLEKSKSDL